jgi:zinc-binding in reverse transcriptase
MTLQLIFYTTDDYCIRPLPLLILISVSSAFDRGVLKFIFTRAFTGVCLIEWQLLNQDIHIFSLNPLSKDPIKWRWSLAGIFTVHTLYDWLQYGLIPNLEFISIWNSKFPLKIKTFLWLIRRNRILTKVNLKKEWLSSTQYIYIYIYLLWWGILRLSFYYVHLLVLYDNTFLDIFFNFSRDSIVRFMEFRF